MEYLIQESFPLSSFDFSSSFVMYSSDEDVDSYNEQKLDQTCENEDDDTFIEYELHQTDAMSATEMFPPVPPRFEETSEDHDELEFRLSFSSFVPFPGFFPSNTIDPANIFSFRRSFFKVQPPANESNNSDSKGVSSRGVGKSTSHVSIAHMVELNKSFEQPVNVEDDCNDQHQISNYNKSWKLMTTRKSSSTKVNCAADIGIMKLLVKLKSLMVKLQSIRTVNNRCQNRPIRRQETWGIADLVKPFESWGNNLRKKDLKKLVSMKSAKGGTHERSSSKVVAVEEIKSDHLRNLIVTGSNRITKSCPTSIMSSPVHDATAASLSAAIAHCKESLGQPEDFCF